jgi:Fe-S cluster assembly iron-binding protein IscA
MNALRLAFVAVAGVAVSCSPKSTPEVSRPIPKPPIELSPDARQVLKQIASEQKLGDDWWLRFDLVWRPDAQVEITMVRERPGESDFVYDADGIRCAMPKELTSYLKNVRVDWIEDKPKGRFDVSFANQTSAEREAGRRWLREQEERRKAATKNATSKGK